MNSKQIEDIAIYAVKGFFLHSSTVDTYLNDNDKEPAWDGHFYLYNVGDRKKKHLLGRIAVQVKGKTKNDFKVSNFKYPIQMTDLKAYLHEGTIYLVVQEVGNKTKIFRPVRLKI